MSYEELFVRNMGIYTPEEQDRIKNGRVVIAGCGGIGGTMATILARSGVGNFLLLDPEDYEPTNANRQVACFTDTCGQNKAVCIRDEILRINPEANVQVNEQGFDLADIEDVVERADVFVPVMDSWPLSLTAIEIARKSKPTIMSYPVGALGRACVFTADSPTVAECLAMPYGYGYEELQEYTTRPEAKALLRYYVTESCWTEEWFQGWVQGKLSHAQICTMVWATASLSALEAVKLLSGKWKPVVAPHYWYITPTSAGIRKFGLGRKLISRLSRREWVQRQFPRLTGSPALLRAFTRLLA